MTGAGVDCDVGIIGWSGNGVGSVYGSAECVELGDEAAGGLSDGVGNNSSSGVPVISPNAGDGACSG